MDAEEVRAIAGERVLIYPEDAPPIEEPRQINDLIGAAWGGEAGWIALAADRLGEAFFDLRSGLAGEIMQKFSNYRIGLAVVGDVSAWTSESKALRDFVFESNQGRTVIFVSDMAELERRLSGSGD